MMPTPIRRGASVWLYPGIELPTDARIVGTVHDIEKNLSMVVLEAPYLPQWAEGTQCVEFQSIARMLADAALRVELEMKFPKRLA